MANTNWNIDRSPTHLLHRASQCVNELFQRQFGDSAMTPRQLALMLALSEKEGVSQTHLAHHTSIDRSTLAELTYRLVKRGWLHRRRSRSDARAYVVTLTEEGRAKVKQALPLFRKVEDALLNELPRKDAELFVARLNRIITQLEPRPHP